MISHGRSPYTTSELLYLREKEGLTNQEIASRCGICVKTVISRIGIQPRRAKDQQEKHGTERELKEE